MPKRVGLKTPSGGRRTVTPKRKVVPSSRLNGHGKSLQIEIEREDDGRFIAEIASLPGVMVYGMTRADAIEKVKALALRVLADQIREKGTRRRVATLFSLA
jgi:predicted RNase H-like HicB family nuclease